MVFLIPILLLLILIVLLVGAARVKASILRNLQIMAACGVLAVLWTTARSLPPEFWWAVGVVAAVAAAFGAVKVFHVLKREKAEMHAHLAEVGFTEDEVAEYDRLAKDDQAQLFKSVQLRKYRVDMRDNLSDYGFTEDEFNRYTAASLDPNGYEEALAIRQAATERKAKAAEPKHRRLNIHGY